MPNLQAGFYEIRLKFLIFDLFFYFYDSKLWKQYHSISLEMMRQICNVETDAPQEIPIKVCLTFYNIEICYRGCG